MHPSTKVNHTPESRKNKKKDEKEFDDACSHRLLRDDNRRVHRLYE